MEEIGRLLKEKRLELGLTIEEVSDQTRLTQKHIKALEEGNISFFHDDLSYLRFFVKSYCDVLGLDFEDIKDELRKDVNDYTMTFTTSAQINHEEIEKNIAKSEKAEQGFHSECKNEAEATVSQAGYVSGIPDCHCGSRGNRNHVCVCRISEIGCR